MDVAAQQTVTKCLYCDSLNQTDQQRRIAEDTPDGWRPPQEWRPPEHAAAPSGQTLRRKRRWSRLVKVLLAFLLIAGVGLGLFSVARLHERQTRLAYEQTEFRMRSSRQAAVHAERTAQELQALKNQVDQNRADKNQAGGGSPAAPVDLFAEGGIQGLLEALQRDLGAADPRLLEVRLYPDRARVVVVSPEPGMANIYDYDGMLAAPTARALAAQEALPGAWFSLSSVAFEKLPGLLVATPSRLHYGQEGQVTGVVIRRPKSRSGAPVAPEIRVYATDGQARGQVIYSSSGQVVPSGQ